MLSARGPKPAWFTPRETSAGGVSLRLTGRDVLAGGTGASTPRAGTAPVGASRAAANSYGAPARYIRADPSPGVTPAGKAGELAMAGGIESRMGLQPDVILPTPRTPPNISEAQKRHRQKGPPGAIEINWGLKNLDIPPPIEGYGCKNNKGEDVAQNFRSGKLFGVAEYINARAEDVYASTKREPLGSGWSRGHVLPDQTRSKGFAFGIASESADHSAKDCIFPRDVENDSEEVRLQYQRTHGSTDPGERIKKQYQWPASVESNPRHRFGAGCLAREGGVKSALSMDCGGEQLSVPNTLIVKDALANFVEIRGDHLARTRNLMQGETKQHLPKAHAFGKRSTSDKESAGELIRGSYSLEEKLPDADLGTCLNRGKRNFETDRPLGVPTVRYDIPAPPIEKRSIANSKNFGDDWGAGSLITPTRFQFQGVNPKDFEVRREPSELRELLVGAGIVIPDSEIDGILKDAANLYEDEDERASLEAVMHVIRVNALEEP